MTSITETLVQYLKLLKDNWECIDCGKKFKTKTEIENHIALEGCKDLTCPQCEKRFNVRHNLLQHIIEIHESSNKYICPKCDKSFKQKRSQVRHSKTCGINEKEKGIKESIRWNINKCQSSSTSSNLRRTILDNLSRLEQEEKKSQKDKEDDVNDDMK